MNLGPILYAEDEENDVFFLKRAFQQAELCHPLVIATDGQEAINYCAGRGRYSNRAEFPQPCLVLLDLNMPKKSGLEVLQWIRQEPSVCTLPVIVLTSSLQNADIHRAYVHGANAYLAKPSRPEEMVVMVKTIKDFWITQNQAAEKGWEFSGNKLRKDGLAP
jgi:CheY-like chemotaxis protein